jgi:hypothetical protein
MLRFQVNPYHDLREEDRDHLIELLTNAFQQASDYVEVIKARPYRSGYVAQAQRPLLPHLNGKGRE